MSYPLAAHAWVRDVVCGMPVDQWAVTFFATYRGTRYFLCSQRCQERFSENPETYLQGPEAKRARTNER
ncbi:MAG: YHS domain-containing protein [Chloroflexi bacterium]|nr:YHS domain-containing protein [Chloroflexota bacterium]